MAGRYLELDADSNVVQHPAAAGLEEKKLSQEDALKQAQEARKKYAKGLKTDERKVWDRTVTEAILIGRFKPFFADFFKQYAVVVARMERFVKLLEKDGWKYTTAGRNGVQHKTRPEAAQYNDDWRKWNSITNQMGMSPATDARFHNKQPDFFMDDPYGNY